MMNVVVGFAFKYCRSGEMEMKDMTEKGNSRTFIYRATICQPMIYLPT